MLTDSTNLIIAIIKQCSHAVYVSKSVVKNSKPNAFSIFFLSEFVYDTGGVVVVSIPYRCSCSIVFRIKLFSLFCAMVFFCSFYHFKFRKWPFSTAVGHSGVRWPYW